MNFCFIFKFISFSISEFNLSSNKLLEFIIKSRYELIISSASKLFFSLKTKSCLSNLSSSFLVDICSVIFEYFFSFIFIERIFSFIFISFIFNAFDLCSIDSKLLRTNSVNFSLLFIPFEF